MIVVAEPSTSGMIILPPARVPVSKQGSSPLGTSAPPAVKWLYGVARSKKLTVASVSVVVEPIVALLDATSTRPVVCPSIDVNVPVAVRDWTVTEGGSELSSTKAEAEGELSSTGIEADGRAVGCATSVGPEVQSFGHDENQAPQLYGQIERQRRCGNGVNYMRCCSRALGHINISWRV